jgi:hypothetical protein
VHKPSDCLAWLELVTFALVSAGGPGMAVTGQALVVCHLLKRRYQPASVEVVIVCELGDTAMDEVLDQFPHVRVHVLPAEALGQVARQPPRRRTARAAAEVIEVTITAPISDDEDLLGPICRDLVTEGLAAAASIPEPERSIYRRKGGVERDSRGSCVAARHQ